MNIVFIFNDFSLHNHIIQSYINKNKEHIVSIVRVPLVLKNQNRLETAKKIFPKISYRFILEKLKEYFAIKLLTLCPKFLNKGEVFRSLRGIAKLNNLDIFETENIMSRESLLFIRNKNPDLIVSLFHQVIKSDLISIPKLGIINLHPGILPDFKGIQPYFWELVKGSELGGATLHYIQDEMLDTGDIIAETRHKVERNSSVQLNYYLTTKGISFVLTDVIKFISESKLSPLKQDSEAGNYYKWPDSQAVDELYSRGYQIVKLSDIFDILTGRYDGASPCDVKIYTK